MSVDTVRLPALNLPLAGKYDVAVTGGGVAGIAAALAAARMGSKTALIESEGMLTGNVALGGVSTVCGMHLVGDGGALKPIVGGIAAEFIGRLVESKQAIGPIPYKGSSTILTNPWAFTRLADEIVVDEASLDLYLHARVVHVIMDGTRPGGLLIHQVGGLRAIRASTIVDATGDAETSRMAGARTRRGKSIMYPSMMFFMANVGSGEESIKARLMFSKTLEEHWDDPGYEITRREGALIPTARPNEVAVAATRISVGGRDDPPVDAADPDQLTRAEIDGRRQVDELARFVKDNVAGFENAFVSSVAPKLGIRETRTIEGEYTLTEKDILSPNLFDDAIAANAWPIEDHAPGGLTEWKTLPAGKFYQVPYRCLVPKGVNNLLAAGRCISATHEALASARTIALCMATGQAAGIAAHMAAAKKISPKDIDVKTLQQLLVKNGAILDPGS